MSEIAIFAFGGVIFIVTTWATVAFGLRRIHELQREDLEDSPRIEEVVEDSNFTEIYVTRELDGEVTNGSAEANIATPVANTMTA